MLTRTAKLLDISSNGNGYAFADNAGIASWAAGSVTFVSGLRGLPTDKAVMGGVRGGSFSPAGTYAREQAVGDIVRDGFW